MNTRPIETMYAGCLFRSRLEARWAVFFDALGIRWEYEAQGFKVENGDGSDDYYLPDFYLPHLGTWVEVKGSMEGVTDDYLNMIGRATDYGGALPGMSDSGGTSRGLLWLGPIPRVLDGIPCHLILQHDSGGYVNDCHFTHDGKIIPSSREGAYFDGLGSPAKVIRESIQAKVYSEQIWHFDAHCVPALRAAYRGARSARFEHGIKGDPMNPMREFR